MADTMIVEAHDPNGQLIDTLARIPNGRWGQDDHEALGTYWLPRLFYAGAEVDAGGSTVALAYGMNAEVRVLDDEFNLRLIVRWAEPGREVTGRGCGCVARRLRREPGEAGLFPNGRSA